MTHDTRNQDGKECPHLQFEADDLDISFDFPINELHFPKESEYQVYRRQCDLISHLCDADEGENIRRIVPVDISRSGVTLITRFNAAMEASMDVMLDALAIISEVPAEHIEWELTFTNEEHHYADVVPDDSGYYRLMTEEELIEMYYGPESSTQLYGVEPSGYDDGYSGYSEDLGGM